MAFEVEMEEYRRIYNLTFGEGRPKQEAAPGLRRTSHVPSTVEPSTPHMEGGSPLGWAPTAMFGPGATVADAKVALYEQYERDVEAARERLHRGLRRLEESS